MSVKKKESDFPEVKGDAFWIRKMRTLFRRLDSNGNGFLQIEEFLEIATTMIAEMPKMESFKGDELVNAAVELWYGHICVASCCGDTGKMAEMLNESQFVDRMKATVNNPDFKTRFEDIMVKPFFNAADADNDGFLSSMEYRVLMRSWKAPDRDAEGVFKIENTDRSNKMSLETFHFIMAEYFYSEDPKSKLKQLWGPLVMYKRPEDYGELECGPFWEGKMRTMFRRMDVSGHGKLKCHDFIQIARGIMQRGHLDRKKGEAVMRALLNIWVRFIAVDKDGKHLTEVTERKFIHNLRAMINGKFRRDIDEFGWTFFKAVEIDGNGSISLNEFRNLQEAWNVNRDEAEAMFKAIDTDKDKQVCADEYLNAWCDYFLGEDTSSPYRSFFGPVIVKTVTGRDGSPQPEDED